MGKYSLLICGCSLLNNIQNNLLFTFMYQNLTTPNNLYRYEKTFILNSSVQL